MALYILCMKVFLASSLDLSLGASYPPGVNSALGKKKKKTTLGVKLQSAPGTELWDLCFAVL